jgi:hypothetical protein
MPASAAPATALSILRLSQTHGLWQPGASAAAGASALLRCHGSPDPLVESGLLTHVSAIVALSG